MCILVLPGGLISEEKNEGGQRHENNRKHFIDHGLTLTPERSSYQLQSASSFTRNLKINGRFNSSVLDDKIYNSLLHVIRKCVRIPSVLNVIQVADMADMYQTEL